MHWVNDWPDGAVRVMHYLHEGGQELVGGVKGSMLQLLSGY